MATSGAATEPEGERLQSVKRALAVLEVLATRPDGVTPKELGQKLGLHLSTSYRLLNTLVAAGYAVRCPDGGLFRLGPRVAYLHHGYLAAVTPPPETVAFVHALQQATGETAMLVRLEEDDIISAAAVPGSRPDAHPPGFVGLAAPAHAVAAGRVLLAWLPAGALDGYLERRAREVAPPFPLPNPAALRAELGQIRETGHALDHGEGDRGTCCVAAPVADRAGEITTAISVLMPCSRFRRDEASLVATVRAVAGAIGAVQESLPPRAAGDGTSGATPQAAIDAAMASLAEAMSRVA